MGLKQQPAEAAICCQERELSLYGDDREHHRRAGGCSLGANTSGQWKSPELAVVAGASSQVGYHINVT